jgi:hypothetical protein
MQPFAEPHERERCGSWRREAHEGERRGELLQKELHQPNCVKLSSKGLLI